MTLTLEEINDPAFKPPDQFKLWRSPLKFGMRLLWGYAALWAPLLFFWISIFLGVIGHEKAIVSFVLSLMICLLLSPLWLAYLYLDWHHLTAKGPVFVLDKSGLFIRYINGGITLPWSQIDSGPLEEGDINMAFVSLSITVDPSIVRKVPPLGRWLGREVLPSGLERRRLNFPRVYELSGLEIKALMRAYKQVAEKADGTAVTSRTLVLDGRPTLVERRYR